MNKRYKHLTRLPECDDLTTKFGARVVITHPDPSACHQEGVLKKMLPRGRAMVELDNPRDNGSKWASVSYGCIWLL